MSKTEGVDSAKINFLTERLTVESEVDESELLSTLSKVARAFDKNIKIEK